MDQLRKKGKLLLVVIFFLVPLLVNTESTYPIYVLNLIAIWAIVALALNLLVGFGGQISIGHAAFLAIGAYASAIFSQKLGFSFWLALPLSGLFTGMIGFIVGLPAVRLSGHFLAVATLGFGVAVPQIALKWENLTGGAMGMTPPAPVIGSFSFDSDKHFYYISLAVLILVVLAISNLLKTRPGRAFIAIRDSEVAAQAMGINVTMYKALLFSISAFFTGIAGSLYAHFVHYISPHDFNIEMSFLALAMVVVGGVGSITGSIIGAGLLTLVPEWTAGVQGLSITFTGLVLVLVVLFMPNGLAGLRIRKRQSNPRVAESSIQSSDALVNPNKSVTNSVGGES